MSNYSAQSEKVLNSALLTINSSVIVFYSIFGIFGNFQLLWIFKRKPTLRTKTGMLYAINASLHIVCLLDQYIILYFTLFISPITRNVCFPFMNHHLLASILQYFVTFSIAMDLFFCIVLPLKYSFLSPVKILAAVAVFLLLPTAFCFQLLWEVWRSPSSQTIMMCSGPGVLPSVLRDRYVTLYTSTNIATLFVFCLSFSYVKVKGMVNNSMQKRVLRNSSVIIIGFVFSNIICSVIYSLPIWISVLREYDQQCSSLGVRFHRPGHIVWMLAVFSLFSFTQNFYICIIKSKEYRNAFKEQLYLMTGRKQPIRELGMSKSFVT